ncbi:MAG: transglutaminase domain-containing protein [Parasporobacterium sp.]|nr:transglutaminase domain-containing protein [Parasporobacterium sp.]
MKRRSGLVLKIILIGLICLLAGCGGRSGGQTPDDPDGPKPGDFKSAYFPAVFDNPEYIADNVSLDTSTAGDGYVGLSIVNENNIKIILVSPEKDYVYDVPHDGTTFYLPLSEGDGDYILRVMQNTTDNRYLELASREIHVEDNDEFDPFVHPNYYVNFNPEMDCIKKAAEFAAESASDADFTVKVYDFIKKTVEYDWELAATVQSGYVPDPDRTFNSGKGICFDYASLAASMLRSQGIPTRLITGYMGNEALFHAWNAVYLKEYGWVSVEFKFDRENWNRFDLTLAASNQSTDIYVDSFVY